MHAGTLRGSARQGRFHTPGSLSAVKGRCGRENGRCHKACALWGNSEQRRDLEQEPALLDLCSAHHEPYFLDSVVIISST